LLDSNGNDVLSGISSLIIHNDGSSYMVSNVKNRMASLSFPLHISDNIKGSSKTVGEVTGTCFVIGKGHDYSPTNLTYDFLTNWHVESMSEQVRSPHYLFGVPYEGTEISKVNFSNFVWIGHGKNSSWSNNIGTDCELFEATIPPVSSLSNNISSIVSDKLSSINYILDNTEYGFADDITSGDEWKNQEYYIGGYPRDSSGHYTFQFSVARINYCQGYANKDWNNPKEGSTISHFLDTKKKWSVSNDILLNPTTCDALQEGASGSLVMNNSMKIFGIFWGQRVNDSNQVESGNIEPLIGITDNEDNFINSTNMSSLFPQWIGRS